jgi:hypothetical protein
MGRTEDPRHAAVQLADESLAERNLLLPAGVLRDDGQVCRRVRLRALTGADEEALFERGAGSGSARVTAFLSRAIDAIEGFEAPIDEALVSSMQLGDRDYLLLRLRQIELGDAVHRVTLPGMWAKVDVDFAISELPVRRLTAPEATHHILSAAVRRGAPAHRGRPAGDRGAGVAQPGCRQRCCSRACAAGRRLRAHGRRHPRLVARPARAELVAWLDAHAPGPDLFLDLTCPHCKADAGYAFDLSAFFYRALERIGPIDGRNSPAGAALPLVGSRHPGAARVKAARYLALLARHLSQASPRGPEA